MGRSEVLSDLDEIAGVECHHDGAAGCLVKRGAGGKAFADEDRTLGIGEPRADDEQPARGRKIRAEQLVPVGADRLQRLYLAVRTLKRDENVCAIEPRAVWADALGREIWMAGIGGIGRNPALARLAHGRIAPRCLLGLEPRLAGLELGDAVGRHDREGPACQVLGSLADVEAGLVLQKIEDVAMRPATEAVVPLVLRVDGKRRRALFMERAEPNELVAATLQGDMLADRLGQRKLVLDGLDIDAACFDATRHRGHSHFPGCG